MRGDAVMLGGPQDGVVFEAEDRNVVEVEFGRLVHCYIATAAQRQGRTVYVYDGILDPHGLLTGLTDDDATDAPEPYDSGAPSTAAVAQD